MVWLSNPNGKHWPHNMTTPVTVADLIERLAD